MGDVSGMPLLPNLIISGAPKCGTTSLYHYLADHPQVCAANEQETRYLIDQDYPLFRPGCNFSKSGLEGYRQFFPDFDAGLHDVLLECTPDYLYQNTALDAISSMPNKPDVVFVLRKPSRRIYSLYKFAQNNIGVLEEGLSFSDFVLAVREKKIPAEKKILANALDHSYYAKHLCRWVEALGQDRVIVILFEDLVKYPLESMTTFAARIGIDQEFYNSYQFNQQNRTIQVKDRKLYNAVRSIKKNMPLVRDLTPLMTPLKRWYQRRAIKEVSSELGTDELRILAELDSEFEDKNLELQGLVGINAARWL